MRVKLLGRDGSRKVLLVYPTTHEEYRRALETLGRPDGAGAEGAGTDADRAGHGVHTGGYVVTTEEQRHRWGLPDLSAGARRVDEAGALEVLCDAAARSASAVEPSAEAGAAPSPGKGALSDEFAAVRALATTGPRVERVLEALEGGVLPAVVQKRLRRALRGAARSGKTALARALDRAAMAVALPWRTRAPARFDPAHLREMLDRTHAGLDRVKSRLVAVLAASRHAGGLLTVEAPPRRGGADDAPQAVLVCPRTLPAPARVPCLAGPRGAGKTSLALAAAEAIGPHVRLILSEDDTVQQIRGGEDDAAGCILRGLREAGVRNPIFLLEGIDRVGPDVAEALRDVLDPVRGAAFEDRYVQVPFDLSAVLWIVTATDPEAVPDPVRHRLDVIEMAGYTEQEKLAIAEQHLLKRPFDAGVPASAPSLAPEPATAGTEAVPDIPVIELDVASLAELEALTAKPPMAAAEAWRTAASAGVVRFERAAVHEVIRVHTNEAGVTELQAKLARVCRHVLARRPPDAREPEVVTPAVVRDALGEGAADQLPPAVRDAIARERRRLGEESDSGRVSFEYSISHSQQMTYFRCASHGSPARSLIFSGNPVALRGPSRTIPARRPMVSSPVSRSSSPPPERRCILPAAWRGRAGRPSRTVPPWCSAFPIPPWMGARSRRQGVRASSSSVSINRPERVYRGSAALRSRQVAVERLGVGSALVRDGGRRALPESPKTAVSRPGRGRPHDGRCPVAATVVGVRPGCRRGRRGSGHRGPRGPWLRRSRPSGSRGP